MPFVVDASVVGSWVLPDENHPEALAALERLKDDEAFAPSLLWFELRNLLRYRCGIRWGHVRWGRNRDQGLRLASYRTQNQAPRRPQSQ